MTFLSNFALYISVADQGWHPALCHSKGRFQLSLGAVQPLCYNSFWQCCVLRFIPNQHCKFNFLAVWDKATSGLFINLSSQTKLVRLVQHCSQTSPPIWQVLNGCQTSAMERGPGYLVSAELLEETCFTMFWSAVCSLMLWVLALLSIELLVFSNITDGLLQPLGRSH